MMLAEKLVPERGNLENFIEQFSVFSSAPNGIRKLREIVLWQAVTGRLVNQSQEEVPFELTLNSIDDLCRRDSVNRVMIRPGHLEELEQIALVLPRGWQWCSLAQLSVFLGGGTPSKNKSTYWEGEIPWVSPKDMKSDFICDSEMKITDEGLKNSTVKLVPKGSLILVARSGILKRTLPVAINKIDCTLNQDMKALVPVLAEMAHYLKMMLFGFTPFILRVLVKSGMTVQSLRYKEFEAFKFPLPPLAEQKRIVAKVDELMALCNQLEAQQQQQANTVLRANTAAIAALLNSESHSTNPLANKQDNADIAPATAAKVNKIKNPTFEQNWQRIAQHFNTLYGCTLPMPSGGGRKKKYLVASENLKILRETILQLAVSGKLTRNINWNYDLIALGKSRKLEYENTADAMKAEGKRVPKLPIFESKISEDKPAVWASISVESACTFIIDCPHSTPKFEDKGEYCIDTNSISPRRILWEKARKVSNEKYLSRVERLVPKKGDLLFGREGTIGTAVLLSENRRICLGQRMMLFRFASFISPQYSEIYLLSGYFKSQYQPLITQVSEFKIDKILVR